MRGFRNASSVRVVVLVSAVLLSLQALVLADVVHLQGGGKWEGEIIEETAFHVKIVTKAGVQTVPIDEVEWIERVKTDAQLFEDNLAAARSAQAAYDAGLWAQERGLETAARRGFEKAIAFDSNHKEARAALGYVWYKDRWLDEKQYNEAIGNVWLEGAGWVPKEKLEEYRRLEEKKRIEAAKAQAKDALERLRGVPFPEATWGSPYCHIRKHYVVRCNSAPEVGANYADFMEKLFAKYDKIFGAFPKFLPDTWEGKERGEKHRSSVFVLRNHSEFKEMLQMPDGVGGYYVPEAYSGLPPRIVCAYHGTFGDSGNTFTVLAHEGTHQFEHLVMEGEFMKKPTWLIEGLAVYFGDGFRLDKKGNIEIGYPQDRLGQLLQEYKTPHYVKVPKLIRIPHRAFGGREYAYGWAVINTLVDKASPCNSNGSRAGLQVFNDWFQLVAAGEPKPEEFEKLVKDQLDMDMERFDAVVRDFTASLTLDSVGAWKGSDYTSTEFGFSFRRPPSGNGWQFTQDNLRPGERVAVENSKNSGRIGIIAQMNGLGADGAVWVNRLSDGISGRYSDFKWIQKEPREFIVSGSKNIIGHEILFTGTEQQSQTGVEKVRSAKQKVRVVVMATPQKIYIVRCQANVDDYDTNASDFDAIFDNFRIEDK